MMKNMGKTCRKSYEKMVITTGMESENLQNHGKLHGKSGVTLVTWDRVRGKEPT
jgi:hypothetical protein